MFKKLILLLALALSAFCSFAQSAVGWPPGDYYSPGINGGIAILSSGVVLINLNSATAVTEYFVRPGSVPGWGYAPGTPACNTTNRYALDVTTVGGQRMYASLMLAYYAIFGETLATVSRTHMAFNGTGNCSAWADSETLSWLTTVGQ